MELSIVLCTYNRSASLREALASFEQLHLPAGLSWELVLVDNNSTDDTPEIIREFARSSGFDVHYVFEAMQGKSFALNAGIRKARGAVIAFTDDDVAAHPRWLVELKDAFAHVDWNCVAGRVVPVWSHPQPDWLELDNQQAVVHFEYGDQLREIDVPPIGANMAFRRCVFERYGLFRVALGPNKHEVGGTEDMEFGSRLMRAGEKIVYLPEAVIYHPVDTSRVTRRYLLRWAYSIGKKVFRARLWPSDCVRYWGVPRYLIRGLAENSLRCAVTLDPKKRFRHKMNAYRSAGGIREALRQAKAECNEVPALVGFSERRPEPPISCSAAKETPRRAEKDGL